MKNTKFKNEIKPIFAMINIDGINKKSTQCEFQDKPESFLAGN